MLSNVLRAMTFAAVILGTLAACDREQPVEVFVPPYGDAESGKQVFIKYQCYNCHSIPDVELPESVAEPPMVLVLGGRVHRVRNYGDLLTAVMYPDHVVSPKFVGALKTAGEDPDAAQMPDFTYLMTVAELVDLTAFLDAEYARLLDRQYQGK